MATESQQIIDRLRTDRGAYDSAAVKEGTIWGTTFSDPSQTELRASEQEASTQLRIRRDCLALPQIARQSGWVFENGLSLGCGSGRAERHLMKLGVCRRFHGVDVADDAVAEARRLAAEENLDITYSVGDLNYPDLGREKYDLVVTQTCLHHVLELEKLAEAIMGCLRPGGLMWIDDFIGETQFQWLDARMEAANHLLSILPERYRYSRLQKRALVRIDRRPPGKLVSPFEAIRSGEIVPVFTSRFDVEIKAEQNAVLQLICPMGTRRNYLETEDGVALFESLLFSDKILINSGSLPPLSGQFVLRRR